MSNKVTAEEIAYGKTKELLLPSGRKVIIREQNGEDDDILSNPLEAQTGMNINRFIQGIVVKALWKKGGTRLTLEEATDLLSKDRMFILFSSRIHSLGKIMKFEYDWGVENKRGGKFNYEENLERYLWDYTKEFPEQYISDEKGEKTLNKSYDKQRMEPYMENAYGYFERTLTSGKEVRFHLLDGHSEAYLLSLNEAENTKNTMLKAMGLEMKNGESWDKVENFRFFSAKDMIELRTFTSELEDGYSPITEIKNPNTNEELHYPIMRGSDFFYPEGI